MSEQQQETPVWHAIVGEGWEPVLIGELARQNDQVLEAQGWVDNSDGGGFILQECGKPRRRRKRLYEIRTMIGFAQYCRIKKAKPGDCFMLTQDGELVPIEVEE